MSRGAGLEAGLLAGLLLVLPAVEAPKHILMAAWLLAWGCNRWRSGDWGGPWRMLDTLLAAWTASALLSTALAPDHAPAWGALSDPLRQTLTAWAASRAGYGPRARRLLLLAAACGVALPLVHGTWLAYGAGTQTWITLDSVGHVNHSAIYLALGTLCVMALAFLDDGLDRRARPALHAMTAWFAVSLALTASRAAILAFIVSGLWMLGTAMRRHRWPMRRLFTLAAVGLGVLMAAGFVGRAHEGAARQSWWDKFHEQAAASRPLSLRDQTWANAVDAWRHAPLLGIGPEQYRLLTPPRLCAMRAERGEPCDPATRLRFDHAHGLWFQTMADRGTLGLVVLAGLLAWWSRAVFVTRDADPAPAEDAPRAAAAAALLVVLVAGLMNTTLRVEHGQLAFLLMGLWADRLRQARNRGGASTSMESVPPLAGSRP